MGTCKGFGGVDSSPSRSSACSFAANAVITKQSYSRKQEKERKIPFKYYIFFILFLHLSNRYRAKWSRQILVFEQPCLVMAELALISVIQPNRNTFIPLGEPVRVKDGKLPRLDASQVKEDKKKPTTH